MKNPHNSYKWLPSEELREDSDGVTFSLKSRTMTVPLSFYRKVVDYILGLELVTEKPYPKVSDPEMFIESLILIKMWEEDVAHGFRIEIGTNYFNKIAV